MELFYAPGLRDGITLLDEGESRHCAAVLRHKEGDHIFLLDGKGTRYEAVLNRVHKKQCEFEVVQQWDSKKPDREIHLAVAPTRNISRFEWFLEKATELGATRITPLKTARTFTKKGKDERWEKILVSALKQCNRMWLPVLDPLTSFDAFCKFESTYPFAIAHCMEGAERSFTEVVASNSSLCAIIGPEGDFTEEEVAQAGNALQAIPVSLGKARLRTETAAVTAVTLMAFAER